MSRIVESLYRVSGLKLDESVSNTIKNKYKNISIKRGYPLEYSFELKFFLKDEVLSKYANEAKMVLNLWDKSFNQLIDKLPRSVDRKAYYDIYDIGPVFVLITENYKLGFVKLEKPIQSSKRKANAKYTGNPRSILKFEDKFGNKVDKDFDDFSSLCVEAYNLTNDNMFKELKLAYEYIKDIYSLLDEGHITFSKDSSANTMDIYCDDDIIYESHYDSDKKKWVEEWKI